MLVKGRALSPGRLLKMHLTVVRRRAKRWGAMHSPSAFGRNASTLQKKKPNSRREGAEGDPTPTPRLHSHWSQWWGAAANSLAAWRVPYFLPTTPGWAHAKNIALECSHITGEKNGWADDLSRSRLEGFRRRQANRL